MSADDLPTVYEWYTEPGTAAIAGCVVRDYETFSDEYRQLIASPSAACFVVRDGGESIGLAEVRGIMRFAGVLQGEAVLWLGKRRGAVYGLRVIAWLLDFAFGQQCLERLWYWVDNRNTSMLSISEKLGILRRDAPSVDGSASIFEIDIDCYSVLRSCRVLARFRPQMFSREGVIPWEVAQNASATTAFGSSD